MTPRHTARRGGVNRREIARLVGVAVAAAAVVACSAGTRQSVLRTLFDDPPGAEHPVSPRAVEQARADSVRAAEEAALAARSKRYLHPPYEDDACDECHAVSASASFRPEFRAQPPSDDYSSASPSRLLFPREKICYECHDDMTPEELAPDGETIHGPVEDGECLECHDPHQSRYPKMLRLGDPFEKLCFQCHDPEDIEGEPHDALEGEDRVCIRCHDPHVSEREYLIKPDAPIPGGEDE